MGESHEQSAKATSDIANTRRLVIRIMFSFNVERILYSAQLFFCANRVFVESMLIGNNRAISGEGRVQLNS